jgi:hypothetical protein
MAELIAIVGNSGSGKSSSIRTLDPTSTFIINVAGKPLPFKGWKTKYPFLKKNENGQLSGNLHNTSNVDEIDTLLQYVDKQRKDIKVVVLEDCQYLMAFEAMERSQEKSYDKFVQIASHFYKVIDRARKMRDDLKIFILTHAENIGTPEAPSYKMKTVGKMLDNMVTLEGLFTYVFYTAIGKDETTGAPSYKLITQSDGTTTAKTPLGCFDDMLIDNDMDYIVKKIDEYNTGE